MTTSTGAQGHSRPAGKSSPGSTPGSPQRGRAGLLRRAVSKLTQSEAELDAVRLQVDSDRLGGTLIATLADRQTAHVCGTVRTVTLRPRVNVPALVVELYDGSKTLNLIWLGRRGIGGIEPGTYLRAFGRVTYQRGTPTIFNPSYVIVPAHGQ